MSVIRRKKKTSPSKSSAPSKPGVPAPASLEEAGEQHRTALSNAHFQEVGGTAGVTPRAAALVHEMNTHVPQACPTCKSAVSTGRGIHPYAFIK